MSVVIVSAARTAVGKAPRGALRFTRPDEMAAAVMRAALERARPSEGAEWGAGAPASEEPGSGRSPD